MADTITVTYKVKEDGSLQKISKNADKAASSTKKATDAASRHNKQQKGVIGATSNSTKAFSKMTTGITGGLVPAYATLAANVFALTALFGALSKAASLRLLEDGLVRVGNAAGTNLKVVSDRLKDITDNAISTETSMRSTALAVSAGFSTKQLEDLTKVAKGASVALGRDMADALDRLVRGTAKLEPEILDELGIMVRLDDAVADYAVGLNKAANELTQYERRMAFLTATNEQGLKKFGALADVAQVNPYDKLAASFANLAKVGVNLLNVVVEPFVNFLSQNTFALTGAVTLFAGTLVSQITPAIKDSAAAATEMASKASKAASRLAAKTTAAFQKSAKAVSSFQFAPKSLGGLEMNLRKGAVSAGQLKDGIKKLQASEDRRQKNLDNGHLKNVKQKQKEITDIRALKNELIALQKQEKASQATGGALGKAKGMSSTSRKTAAAFKMMDNAGPLKGFQIAAASVAKQTKDIAKASGALNKLSIGFAVAGNSAKLFGTALLNAIPVIGQIIMVASILGPILMKLFEKDKLTQAAEKAAKGFESFDGISRQLGKTLAATTSEAERFVVAMRAQIGLIEQLKTAFSALEEAQAERHQAELLRLKTELLAVERQFKNTRDHYIQAGTLESNVAKNELNNIQKRINAKKKLFDEELAISQKISEAQGLLLLEQNISRFEGNSALADNFPEEIASIKALKTAFEEANKSGAGMTYNDLQESLDLILGKNKEVIASIDAAKQVYNDFRKELTALGDKGSHALDKVIQSQISLKEEMISSGKEGGKGLVAFMKQLPDLQKRLDRFRAKRMPMMFKDEAAILDEMIVSVIKQKDIMVKQVQVQKGLRVEMGKIKEFTSGNAVATRALLDLEEEVRISKEASLKAEREAFTLLEMETTKKDRLAAITRELAVIDAERANTAIETLRVNIESIKHAQTMFGLTNQIAAAEKQSSLDTMKRATMETKIARLKSGKDFTAADESADFEKNKAERLRLIGLETDAKLTSLDLEFKLLTAQTKLQKERAILVAEEQGLDASSISGVYDEILGILPEVAAARGAAIISEDLTQQKALELEGATKTRAVQTAVSGAATGSSAGGMGGTDTTYGRLTNVNEQGGMDALTDPQEKLAAMKGMVDPMLENLRSLGPEGELVAAVTAGSFAMADSFMTMGENLKNASDGLGKGAAVAQMAGQAFAQIGAISAAASKAKVAGIDKEIAAEKKRDGTSSASLAKIKAMEKKKEAIKRKEFETNKKMQMGQVVANTAAGIMGVLSGIKDPLVTAPLAVAQAAMIGAMGVAQLATIAGTSFQGGGSISSASGGTPSKISIGQRNNSVDLAKSKSASGELGYMRGEDGVGGAGNFRPAFSGYKHRAGGGYVVGEQGPEVFMPDVPGEIVASGQGTGGMTNVSFNINTVDATGVEELLIGQKGNIIGMIRDAANSYGESFMDGVDTTVYNKTTEGVSKY